jgi:hypothetical protein
MKKLAVTLALTAAFLLGSASSAHGQDTEVINASVTIPTMLVLSVSSNTLAFGTATEADLDAGTMAGPAAMDLAYKGNVPMDLDVAAYTDFCDAVDAANDNTKPSTDLSFTASGGSSASGTLDTTGDNLFSGLARGSYASGTTSVTYDVVTAWTEAPDTYTLSFTFTLSAN